MIRIRPIKKRLGTEKDNTVAAIRGEVIGLEVSSGGSVGIWSIRGRNNLTSKEKDKD